MRTDFKSAMNWALGFAFVCAEMSYLSLNVDSPGTTAGSTWDHQTAYLLSSPCTPRGMLACCDVSRTAALPTAPAHTHTEDTFGFFTPSYMRWRLRGEMDQPKAATHPIIL